MIVALDATALILLLNREAAGPIDPATGRPIAAQERLAYLAAQVGRAKGGRLIIPTPAFAEAAVRIEPEVAGRYLGIFERLRAMRVADFNKVAALEFALMQRELLAEVPRRKMRSETETRSKAKFDQQIVAIAKVERASFIVTDDEGLAHYAERFGLMARKVGALSLPPSSAQGSLPLAPPEPVEPPDDPDPTDAAGAGEP